MQNPKKLLSLARYLPAVLRDLPGQFPSEEISTRPNPLSEPAGQMILRMALITISVLALGIAITFWDSADVYQRPTSIWISRAIYPIVLLTLFLAARRTIPTLTVWLIPLLAMFVYIGYWQQVDVYREQLGSIASTDVWMFSDYGARLLQIGENPYEHDMTQSFMLYRSPVTFATPLLTGDFSERMPYPSLAFLIMLPFQWLNIDSSLLYPLVLLIVFGVLFWHSPPLARPLILLPWFAESRYLAFTFGGVSDIVWTLFLLLVMVTWERPKQRAIWYGLACSFKQHPWFFMPFMLIRIWHEAEPDQRLWRMGQFILISGGVFFALNFPFMVWNFGAWVSGVFEPLRANMIILGQGLSTLALVGIVNIPKEFYGFYTYGIYALAIILYWRHFANWREMMWLVPGIMLWFGHRSLSSYWYYYLILFLFALVRQWSSAYSEPFPHLKRIWRTRYSVGMITLLSLFILGSVIAFASSAPVMTVTLKGAVSVTGSWVRGIQIEVANRSAEPIHPRFSVRSGSAQPFFWQIVDGPQELAPYSTAIYRIRADIPEFGFDMGSGAHVIVSDRDDYAVRSVLLIRSDYSLRDYDAIPNGTMRYWDEARGLPLGWGIIGGERHQASLVEPWADTTALRLQLLPAVSSETYNQVMLDTWVPFPQIPFTVWVNVPSGFNQAPNFSQIYGLEMLSTYNGKRVWVLFGDQAQSGLLSDGTPYWMIAVARNQWTQQTIDGHAIFETLNIPLSEAQSMNWRGLPYPVSMLNLRFLIASTDHNRTLSADFGAIQLTARRPEINQQLIASLENPSAHDVWRAEYAMRSYNETDAENFFMSAIASNPDSASAYYGLAELLVRRANYASALNMLEIASTRNYYNTVAIATQRGKIYSATLQDDLAIEAFEEALTIAGLRPWWLTPQVMAETYGAYAQVVVRQEGCESAETYIRYAYFYDPLSRDASIASNMCRSDRGNQ